MHDAGFVLLVTILRGTLVLEFRVFKFSFCLFGDGSNDAKGLFALREAFRLFTNFFQATGDDIMNSEFSFTKFTYLIFKIFVVKQLEVALSLNIFDQ